MRSGSRRLLPALALGVLAACQPAKDAEPRGIPYPTPQVSKEGKLIAQIGDVPFTTEELEKRIQAQSPFTRVQLADEANKKKFVDSELRLEVLAQEGWRRGLAEDPRMLERLKQLIVTEVMNAEMKKLEDQLEVTDVELIAAYKARFDEFNKPAKIRVAQIVRYVEDDKERAAAKRLLEKVKADVLKAERANDPRAFSRFAKEQSQDEATKSGGGDLNFLTKEQLTQRYGEGVANFLFDEVKVGDMGIADAENAVVLFKKTGRRRGVERTMEMVKPQLRGQVIADKRTRLFEEFVARLMKEQGITVDYSALDDIEVDTGGAQRGVAPAQPGQ